MTNAPAIQTIAIASARAILAGSEGDSYRATEVLRHNRKPKANVTWDKGRGKVVENTLRFKVFKDDRINGHHLSLAEKRATRASLRRN